MAAIVGMKTLGIVGTVSLLVALAPGAAAHPVDAFAFFTPPLAFPNFLPPISPPSVWLPPLTITAVTADDFATPGFFKGAGDCDDLGEGCMTLPTLNPFTGGPVFAFDCEITSAPGPWLALPAVFLAQDVDSSDTIDSFGPDVIFAMSFVYGSPPGPIPPVLGPAGAYGGGLTIFGGGPFVPGLPIHFIAAHPGFPLTPISALLDLDVTCWAL